MMSHLVLDRGSVSIQHHILFLSDVSPARRQAGTPSLFSIPRGPYRRSDIPLRPGLFVIEIIKGHQIPIRSLNGARVTHVLAPTIVAKNDFRPPRPTTVLAQLRADVKL